MPGRPVSQPEYALACKERTVLLNDVLAVLTVLTYREREIVKLRAGLVDGYVHTWTEIGRIFNVTRERVRQIGNRAIRRLQHPRFAERWRQIREACEPPPRHLVSPHAYARYRWREDVPVSPTRGANVMRRGSRGKRMWVPWTEVADCAILAERGYTRPRIGAILGLTESQVYWRIGLARHLMQEGARNA